MTPTAHDDTMDAATSIDQTCTRVVAIRHGETDWNAALRVQGHVDIRLNEVGRQQAARVGAALADAGLHAVYGSDLSRAWDTASAIAKAAGLSPRPEPSLRERAFGEYEGLTYDEIERFHPDCWRRWRDRDPHFAPPGGETLTDFYARATAACAAIAARHRGQSIALVTHGGVLDCLYRAAARLELDAPRSWRLGNAAINRLLHTDQGFALVGWNDEQHLHIA